MHIALVRPYDDTDIIEVQIVDHVTKKPTAFYKEWETCRTKIKAENHEYQVSDIIEAMEKKGWTFLQVLNPVTVTY